MPCITVLLPVYNGEKYLAQAIESILSQTFLSFELLIINDGSTDSSLEIIEDYAKKDARIVFVSRANKGLVYTLNEGVQKAKSNFIARMDADDIALPDRLERQYKALLSDEKVAVIGSSIERITETGISIAISKYPKKHSAVERTILYCSPVAHPAVLMRKDVVLEVGGYCNAYIHAEDYDLWLRIVHKGYLIENLAEVLLKYRENSSGVSSVHARQQKISAINARQDYIKKIENQRKRCAHPLEKRVMKQKFAFWEKKNRAEKELLDHNCLLLVEKDSVSVVQNFKRASTLLSNDAKSRYFFQQAGRCKNGRETVVGMVRALRASFVFSLQLFFSRLGIFVIFR